MAKENDNFIKLRFAINGTEYPDDKVNVHQPLHVAVREALKHAGSTRPIEDYNVLFNNQPLDTSRKVEEFSFPSDSLLFLSLKSGEGGTDGFTEAD